ncbi:MAG: large conductance mechanosensitive channel protein MscL [Candidatus Hydrogenedentes bacterium]|nr:large conductance mechanosensitive channel protein MscL [Candidatus Hydrogenedentota bacterium]
MAIQAVKGASSLLSEFKAFALKGNVVDLAVAVIIGAAFGKIIDSLVKDIIMPAISLVMPADQSYTEWAYTVGNKVIPYGKFLGEVVNFVIVALALWIFTVKFLGYLLRAKKVEEAAAPLIPTKDQELLTEIRDLLQAKTPGQ